MRRFHDTYHNEALTVRGGVINRPWADRLLLGFTLAGMHKDLQTGVRQEVVYGKKYRFGHSFMPSLQYAKRNLLHNRLDLTLTANYNRNLTTNVDTAAYAFNWRGESIPRNSPGEQNYLHLRYNDDNWNAGLDARFRLDERNLLTFHHTFGRFDRNSTSLLARENEKAPIGRGTTKHISGLSYLFTPNERWNVTAFGKFYHLQVSGPVSTSDLQEKFVRKEHQLGFFGFGAAGTYRFSSHWQGKLSYERACRLPNVDELFGDDDLESGSVTLQPEQSHNVNLNISYTLRSGLHHLLVEVGGIFRDTRDYIQRNVISVGGRSFRRQLCQFRTRAHLRPQLLLTLRSWAPPQRRRQLHLHGRARQHAFGARWRDAQLWLPRPHAESPLFVRRCRSHPAVAAERLAQSRLFVDLRQSISPQFHVLLLTFRREQGRIRRSRPTFSQPQRHPHARQWALCRES